MTMMFPAASRLDLPAKRRRGVVRTLVASFAAARRRSLAARSLGGLDDRILKDIGLTRGEIHSVAADPDLKTRNRG